MVRIGVRRPGAPARVLLERVRAGDNRSLRTAGYSQQTRARGRASGRSAAPVRAEWAVCSGSSVGGDIEASLWAQIAADPDDPEPYLVYADWLSSSADPIASAHGALIALQHRLSSADDPALRAEETTLRERLLPALAPLRLDEDDALQWRWGFIHRATLCDPHFRRPARPTSLALLEALLELPAARFLRELDVHAHDVRELERVVARLAATRPAALRWLAVGERFPDSDDLVDGIVLEDVSALWSLELDELCLRAARLGLGAIDAPTVRQIHFEGGLDAEALGSLAGARWPRLRAFSATHGRYTYGSYGPPGTFDGDALCAVLAGSAWADQLIELDLEECGITDAGARQLQRLPRIEKIDLSENPLSEAALAEARARWPALVYR